VITLHYSGLPIAQGQSTAKDAAYVCFWMSGAIPDTLNWRVAPTRHAIYRIILAINIDDDSPRPFAAQLPLHFLGVLAVPAENAENEQRYDRNEEPHDCPYTRGLVSSRTSFQAVKVDVGPRNFHRALHLALPVPCNALKD
jgi:hypothetical protein